ncbi:MAG: hypothetical protein MI743_10145 [Sneathiellales bacterium]|nr:hypothetical protein [Sneathiellales bacterium]
MFSKLFGRGRSNEAVRIVESAQDLLVGDAIRLGFDPRLELSNKEFFVQSVSGLDLSASKGYERRILHLGNTEDNRELIMWSDTQSGQERLAFAYSAAQPHVEEMIQIEQFVELFNPEKNHLVQLQANASPDNNPWLATAYTEDQSKEVYWLKGDPKSINAGDTIDSNEQPCDYFRLIDQSRTFAIEVFVFEGGKTDVYFVNFLPQFLVEEYMASAQ